MAERLEGRKIQTSTCAGGQLGHVLYRVDRFRRFIPNRGLSGRGLIQFWGIRATQSYKAGLAKKDRPPWDTEDRIRLHTVEVEPGLSIKTAKRARA